MKLTIEDLKRVARGEFPKYPQGDREIGVKSYLTPGLEEKRRHVVRELIDTLEYPSDCVERIEDLLSEAYARGVEAGIDSERGR
jgi:hypothetical protein